MYFINEWREEFYYGGVLMQKSDEVIQGGVTYVVNREFVGKKSPKDVIIERLMNLDSENTPLDGGPATVV